MGIQSKRRVLFGCLILPMLLLGSLQVRAQLNESDTLALQYRAALTGHFQTGNLRALTLLGRLELSAAPSEHWAFKTQNNARYQAFFGRKADNDFSSQNFLYLHQRRTFYPFGMAFFSGNFRRKIDFRYFAGPGLSWQALRQPGQLIKLSVAAVYESTVFAGDQFNRPAYNGSDHIRVWRATARVYGQHQFLERQLRLYYELYVQPSLEQADNFRWLAELGLEIPVWKGISFNAHFLYTHENVVLAAVRPDDMILSFGLSVRNLNR